MNAKKTLLSGAGAGLFLTAHKTLAHDAVFHVAEQGQSIISGLTHSFTGFDHLLAMVAVGALASKKDFHGQLQRNFWLLPVLFIICMASGAIMPQFGFNFSPEPLIAGSLIALGVLVMLAKPLPLFYTASIVAGFAFCHGFAHGTAVQLTTAPVATGGHLFILGAVMASALLHASGFTLAHLLKNTVTRIAGLGMVLTGVALSL